MFWVAGAQDSGLDMVPGEVGELTEASGVALEPYSRDTTEIRTRSLAAAEETDEAEFERWPARGTVAETETLLIPKRAAAILVRRPDALLSLECDFDIA